jgi:hypothetical protein
MKKAFVAAFLLLLPCGAFAQWKVERGIKVGSLHDDQVGIIATLPAKSTFKGVSAYLQVECLEHPEVTTRICKHRHVKRHGSQADDVELPVR